MHCSRRPPSIPVSEECQQSRLGSLLRRFVLSRSHTERLIKRGFHNEEDTHHSHHVRDACCSVLGNSRRKLYRTTKPSLDGRSQTSDPSRNPAQVRTSPSFASSLSQAALIPILAKWGVNEHLRAITRAIVLRARTLILRDPELPLVPMPVDHMVGRDLQELWESPGRLTSPVQVVPRGPMAIAAAIAVSAIIA